MNFVFCPHWQSLALLRPQLYCYQTVGSGQTPTLCSWSECKAQSLSEIWHAQRSTFKGIGLQTPEVKRFRGKCGLTCHSCRLKTLTRCSAAGYGGNQGGGGWTRQCMGRPCSVDRAHMSLKHLKGTRRHRMLICGTLNYTSCSDKWINKHMYKQRLFLGTAQ